jgi:hypothetical protein
MSVVGNKPADKLLTSDDVQDGAISTNDLANSAVTSAKIADANITNQKLASNSVSFDKFQFSGSLANRNKIIGGDFTTNPWQRGTSFAAVAASVYTADRWQYQKVGSALHTLSKSVDAPTALQAGIFTQHSLGASVTTAQAVIAAGDFNFIEHKIEGLNSASFGFGQTGVRNVTLSFWVKGAKTGIHCVSFRNSAVNRSYVAEYTINVINTWEFKVITISVDTAGTWLYDNGIGIDIGFTLAAGTTFQTPANTWTAGNFLATANQVNALDTVGNTFKIALVQLEAGEVATPFETRSYGQELALCQRYYETGNVYIIGSATGAGILVGSGGGSDFKVTKRATPVLGFGTATESQNLTSVSFAPITTVGFRAYGTATNAGSAFFTNFWAASAEL